MLAVEDVHQCDVEVFSCFSVDLPDLWAERGARSNKGVANLEAVVSKSPTCKPNLFECVCVKLHYSCQRCVNPRVNACSLSFDILRKQLAKSWAAFRRS